MRHRNYWDDTSVIDRMDDDTGLSEQAEAWMEHEREKDEGLGPVHCGNCGSIMHLCRSSDKFQMSCAYCGVKGPIDDTQHGARSLCRALFPDE